MPTFSTLTGRLLDQELGSADSTNLFTTAKRNAAINDGHKEFARLTQCLEIRSSITITGGTAEYNLLSTTVLPSLTFQEWSQTPVEFRYTDASAQTQILAGDDLPRRDVLWLHKYAPGWQISTVASSVQQLPQLWYERIDGPSRYLGFYPVPSTGSSASAKVFVTYIGQPNDMSASTDEPFTINSAVRTDLRPYHMALVHYAAAQLEKLRRDYDASQTQMQAFVGYVTAWLHAHRRPGGTHVTPARSYFRWRRGRVEDPRT